MPNERRLDLNADLERVSGDFLKDIQAATEEAKNRKASDRAADRRNAEKRKDRKTFTVVIAAATVVLILVSYLVVSGQSDSVAAPPAVQQVNAKITTPVVTPKPRATIHYATTTTTRPVMTAEQQPYDDGQQPGQ